MAGVGRPLKFKTPEDLEDKINEFLIACNVKGITPTKGQLALYLDTTRETLSEYEEKEEYVDALKRIYLIIEENWVQKLTGQAVTGTIFYLKNAYSKNWREKSEQDITSGGKPFVPIYGSLSIKKSNEEDKVE